MQRSVLAGDTRLVYHLTRKRVKNINLRVTGAQVRVSAPKTVPAEAIDAFVLRKAGWILTALERQTRAAAPGPAGQVRILGRWVFVHTAAGPRGITQDEAGLHISLPHPDDDQAVQRLYQSWERRQCQALFARAVEDCLPALVSYGVARPGLRLRRMKSRWGSCQVRRGMITLNTRLLAYPYPVIRYVAAHELCHFVHPNHSRAFYALLEQLQPDYRALWEQLKS